MTSQKSRRGPPADPEKLRRYRIGVHFNDEELARLEVRLGVPGLARVISGGDANGRKRLKQVNERLRRLALDGGSRLPTPVLNVEAFANLGRIGNNIRQIVNGQPMALEDTSIAKAILEELSEFRTALLKGLVQVPSAAQGSNPDAVSLDW